MRDQRPIDGRTRPGPRVRRHRLLCAAWLAFLATASPAAAIAAAAAPAPPAAAKYREALERVRSQPGGDLEALFALAVAAGQAIQDQIVKADEAKAAGEKPPPVVTAMEGLAISTEEALYAVPDPTFFRTLAAKAGRPADKEFFELLAATRPEPAWAVYLEQMTDSAACVRFDLPELPSLYSRWLDFRRRFPAAYREAVAQELEGFDGALLGECACGKKASVVSGLQAFAKALPEAPVTARVQKRLQEIRTGKSKVQFRCKPG
jgi:hypothetical protein